MNGGSTLRKRAAALLTLTGVALAFATPAHAVGEAIFVAPNSVGPGATITIDGTGWTCAADVDIFVDGTLVTSIPFASIAGGAFSTSAAAPNDEGDYMVSAEYGFNQTSTDCEGSADDPFTVVAATTTTSSTTTSTTTSTTAATTTTTTTTMAPSTAPTTDETTTTPAPTTDATTTTDVDAGGPTTTTSGGGGSGGPVSTLPVTGSSSTSTVAPFALLVLAAGAVLVGISRRRTAA